MGLFSRMKSNRKARIASRQRIKKHRQDMREKRRMERIDARARRKAARLHKRDPQDEAPDEESPDVSQAPELPEEPTQVQDPETEEAESEDYESYHSVPIPKSKIRKIGRSYGGLTPMQVEQLHDLSHRHPHMLRHLKHRGIHVENRHDPIEVSAKFVNSHPDMYLDKDTEQHMDAAYNTPPEAYESHFDWASVISTAKSGLKGAIGGVMGQVGAHVEELKDKEKKGIPLTASELKLLGASDSLHKGVEEHVELNLIDTMKSLAPWVITILILLFLGKKLKWF